jgi:hypothetical protein
MLAMIFILTGAAMFFEYKAVTGLPWLYRLMQRSSISILGKQFSTSMIPLMFSLCLSLMLGAVFGAAGLICFIAGLLSTLLMQPIYALMRKGTWGSSKAVLDAKVGAIKLGFQRNKSSIVASVNSFVILAKLFIKIVFFPILVLVKIMNRVAQFCEWFSSH